MVDNSACHGTGGVGDAVYRQRLFRAVAPNAGPTRGSLAWDPNAAAALGWNSEGLHARCGEATRDLAKRLGAARDSAESKDGASSMGTR
jgi:hypothetical protein